MRKVEDWIGVVGGMNPRQFFDFLPLTGISQKEFGSWI